MEAHGKEEKKYERRKLDENKGKNEREKRKHGREEEELKEEDEREREEERNGRETDVTLSPHPALPNTLALPKNRLDRPQPDNAENNNERCLAILNQFYAGDFITFHDIGCHHTKPTICENSNVQVPVPVPQYG
ncbi:hypothetical protein E2C01_017272 [Portunus trituberculatus]|uniref:Uncharacterized protein n=1 Tax=Portunus trituberculatus TaxID=210409 RepID=A0A5B7DSW9_PORTR|nr:hypothetical protein [Portunus trituberculatus]